MNEEQIERRVEKMTDHYDSLLIHGDWTQEDYDKAMRELSAWAKAKHEGGSRHQAGGLNMNYKVEFFTGGVWHSNNILHASKRTAESYAEDLTVRRPEVRLYRVVEVPVPSNETEEEVT